MADFEDFTRHPWKVRDWTIEGVGKIPANGFGRDHHLKIEALLPPGPKLANLTWKNGNGEECLVRELPFKEENGTLYAAKIEVSFAGHQPVSAEVTLSIDRSGVLRGRLVAPKTSSCDPCQEGNTGTFAADADPPREDHGTSGSGRRHRALQPV